MKKYHFFITIVIFGIIFAIIISPSVYISAFKNGLNVWASILLPTIFPLIFFTKLLNDLGVFNNIGTKFKFTEKCFKTPPISLYAFMISILSGYPVGAKIVADLYQNGYITKHEANKISTFTSNSGPMFIYGSVGIGMLGSKTLGFVILISHILGAVCNGFLYRNYNKNIPPKSNTLALPKNKFALSSTMTDSILSILIIGGFISIFFIVIEIFNVLEIFKPIAFLFSCIFNIDSDLIIAILNGILEITHGCLDVTSLNLSNFQTAIICCGIITFGGIATMLQAFVFLQTIEMKPKFFLMQKITHTFFACAICALLLFVFGIN